MIIFTTSESSSQLLYDMLRDKRPLEAIDVNKSRCSNSSSADNKSEEVQYKKAKRSRRSIEAALARARNVCSTMLPAADARRKTIDQSIFASGTVERVHHEEDQQSITFFLISFNVASVEFAELPVVFKGPWVNTHLANGALLENKSIVLAFKEASIGNSRTIEHHNRNSAPFELYLLFDRGVEFWTTPKSTSVQPSSLRLSGSSAWKHYKLFAKAQLQDSITVQTQAIETSTSGERLADGTPQASSVLTRSEPPTAQNNRRNAVKDITQDADEVAAQRCKMSPPTGITQIEGGSPSQLDTVKHENDAFPDAIMNTKGMEYMSVLKLRNFGLAHRDVHVIGIAIHDTSKILYAPGGQNISIRLVDPSVDPSTADDWDSGLWLGVTYLSSSKTYFPDVERGDVLLIRHAKTVNYSKYTRLSVFSDQVCDWVCLPADSLKGLPEAALFKPIHADAFRTCPGAERPDESERKHMQKLALWAREQIITSYNNTWSRTADLADVTSFKQECSVWTERDGPAVPRLFKDMTVPDGAKEIGPLDFVAKIAGIPWRSSTYLGMCVTDYTANPTSCIENYLNGGEHVMNSDMLLRVVLWQNEASDEVVERVLNLLKTKDAVFLFKGVRVRQHDGALNANGRLNKSEFDVQILPPDHSLHHSLARRQLDYMQKIQHEVMKSDVEAVKTRRESTLQPQALPAVIAEADISRPALVSPGFEKEKPLTRLADLRPPANLRDPAAFFDCACEIVEDVYTNEMRSMTTLYVTDFTSNERFWQNSNHPDYPRARVVLQISIFGNEQRQKVATLHHGDRAILRNIRCKLDKQDNLEGHIGERNVFRVEKLSKKHEAYKQLDASRIACLGGSQQDAAETATPVLHIGPSKTFEGVACKFAGHPVDNKILQPLSLDCEKVFRLRGRVIEYSPRQLDQFLVSKCTSCNRHLVRDERLCRVCDDGVIGDAITRQWCFSLRIELEPDGCNIEFDPIEAKRAFWVVVIEGEGDTVFLNGLEPKEESVKEASRLLEQILDKPSSGNGTNPIFDFCVKKTAGQRILRVCDTALRRNNVILPWV